MRRLAFAAPEKIVSASMINVAAYSDALVVLGTAGIVVPIVSRLGFSPVLGYLGAGALLGPLGLGSLTGKIPALYWITVGDAKDVAGIAELGIVFLQLHRQWLDGAVTDPRYAAFRDRGEALLLHTRDIAKGRAR